MSSYLRSSTCPRLYVAEENHVETKQVETETLFAFQAESSCGPHDVSRRFFTVLGLIHIASGVKKRVTGILLLLPCA